MRFVFIAALTILLSIYSASAQVIYVQVERDTGLYTKLHPGSQPDLVVPAGTKLEAGHSIDEITYTDGRRWMYVLYNDKHYLIGTWEPFTTSTVQLTSVIDQSSAAAPAPPANVDNCCFVDRHCHSDQEWDEGYWAYQRNECPISAVQPSPAAAACYNTDHASVSGTMNIRQQPTTLSSIVRRAYAGETVRVTGSQRGAVYCWLNLGDGWMAKTALVKSLWPTTALSARPQIIGEPAFVAGYSSVLDLMALKAPRWYDYVTSAASTIEQHHLTGHDAFANYADSNNRKIISGLRALYLHGNGVLYSVSAAGILAHEACHLHGHDVHPETGEFFHFPCQQAARDVAKEIYAWQG